MFTLNIYLEIEQRISKLKKTLFKFLRNKKAYF